MLKFFRRIRQKLLNEGSLRKYLVYAIGEIFLVMVGILLALQVNNWNENRKTRIELRSIMENLKSECEANLLSLDYVMKRSSNHRESSLYLLSLFGNDSISIDPVALDSLLENTFYFQTWSPSLNVLNELTNSGKLSLIENATLKNLINDWKRRYDELSDWNRRVEKSSQDLIDYVKENGSIRNINHYQLSIPKTKIKVDHTRFLNDLEFENRINEKVLYAQFRKNDLEELREVMLTIIEEAAHF